MIRCSKMQAKITVYAYELTDSAEMYVKPKLLNAFLYQNVREEITYTGHTASLNILSSIH